MASEIWTLMDLSGTLRDVEWNIKTKPKDHESTLEETWTNHVICSTV